MSRTNARVLLAAVVISVGLTLAALPAGATPRASSQPASAPPALNSGVFALRFSATDPEEIVSLSWRRSANLTNTAPTYCGDNEFFGDSWGTAGDAGFVAPVGWGSTGSTVFGTRGITIDSAASGCYGTSGIPVHTVYRFWGRGSSHANRFAVQRRFAFGQTPFAHDLRPYIPRLYPLDAYGQVLHPNASGTALLSENEHVCGFGCVVPDWNGTWFALNDPTTGRGMIVRHVPSIYPVELWMDEDADSWTTATSVLVMAPPGGFRGTLRDKQLFCFYDASTWTPSLTLPAGC